MIFGRLVGLPRICRTGSAPAGNAASSLVTRSKAPAGAAAVRAVRPVATHNAAIARVRLAAAAIANHRVGGPEQRMRVAEDRAAGLVDRAGTVEQRHHRLPQRLAARECWIGALAPEQIRD